MREPDASGQARSELGAELAAYRRAARLSQTQLAERTEFSRSTVANVETGRQHVPRTFWERADQALRTGGVLAKRPRRDRSRSQPGPSDGGTGHERCPPPPHVAASPGHSPARAVGGANEQHFAAPSCLGLSAAG